MIFGFDADLDPVADTNVLTVYQQSRSQIDDGLAVAKRRGFCDVGRMVASILAGTKAHVDFHGFTPYRAVAAG
jgi:hypothetical protein